MNSVWQTVTLSTFPLQQWLNASYLHFLVGPLRAWRKGSWLMQWAEPIGAVLATLVFAMAPFVNNSLTGVLLAACGAYWALLTITDETPNSLAAEATEATPNISNRAPLFTPIHLLVVLYWTVVVVATAMSPVKREAMVGLGKLSLFLVFFALLARVLRSPRIRSCLLTVFLLAALAVSVYGLQQWFSGTAALATWVDPTSPLSKTTRVYSYLGNPNLLAGYLVPAVVFSIAAFFSWRTRTQKALAIVMTVVNGACLVLTFSRGGWIGLVFALLMMLLLLAHWWSVYLPRFWRTWAVPIVLGSATTVLVLAILVVPPLRDRVSSIFVGRGDSSNNYRINVWMAVIDMIQARPVIGIGPGNNAFNKIYPLFQRPRFSALSAYSILLEVAVETGIIGLICFLWLLFVTFTQGWKALQRLRAAKSADGFWLIGAIAAIVGMLGHGMVDTVLYRPEVNTLWWLMFAIIASYYHDRASASVEASRTHS